MIRTEIYFFQIYLEFQESRIPLRMGVLNLVHELMHSFGAKHDPEPSENPKCTPDDKVELLHSIFLRVPTNLIKYRIRINRILIFSAFQFQWVNGRFLMSKYSNDGHKLNHMILSPCTKSKFCLH